MEALWLIQDSYNGIYCRPNVRLSIAMPSLLSLRRRDVAVNIEPQVGMAHESRTLDSNDACVCMECATCPVEDAGQTYTSHRIRNMSLLERNEKM
jgi:hypothetical protein